MSKYLKSRIFIEKCSLLKASDKSGVEKAIERVLARPDDHSFKRDYLTPYRQEHPSNKQLTIFFTHDQDKVFFVWINDYSCPHDTHKSHGEDPCLIEFKKLQQAGLLEDYDFDLHEGKFEIKPRASDPHFMRFSCLYIATHGNILFDGNTYYCMGIVSDDEKGSENDMVMEYHYRLFLDQVHNYFKKEGKDFEFRIPLYDDELLDRLKKSYDPALWKESSTKDLFSLKLL